MSTMLCCIGLAVSMQCLLMPVRAPQWIRLQKQHSPKPCTASAILITYNPLWSHTTYRRWQGAERGNLTVFPWNQDCSVFTNQLGSSGSLKVLVASKCMTKSIPQESYANKDGIRHPMEIRVCILNRPSHNNSLISILKSTQLHCKQLEERKEVKTKYL